MRFPYPVRMRCGFARCRLSIIFRNSCSLICSICSPCAEQTSVGSSFGRRNSFADQLCQQARQHPPAHCLRVPGGTSLFLVEHYPIYPYPWPIIQKQLSVIRYPSSIIHHPSSLYIRYPFHLLRCPIIQYPLYIISFPLSLAFSMRFPLSISHLLCYP